MLSHRQFSHHFSLSSSHVRNSTKMKRKHTSWYSNFHMTNCCCTPMTSQNIWCEAREHEILHFSPFIHYHTYKTSSGGWNFTKWEYFCSMTSFMRAKMHKTCLKIFIIPAQIHFFEWPSQRVSWVHHQFVLLNLSPLKFNFF